jgi:hypothetical protein
VYKGSFEEVNKFFLDQLWSDGLPIIPPTVEKVKQFIKYTDLSPDTSLGALPPAYRQATVWSVAVNGVMAGCRPEYMPVLLALVEAISDPTCSVQDYGSTSGYDPYIILSGPISRQLGFHSGVALLRPGWHANTTVARFLRLYLRNINGFVPGTNDKAWAGRNWQPVIAEDEVNSPWEPLHVTLGFKPGSNTITVVGVQAQTYHDDMPFTTPDSVIETLAYRLTINHIFGPGLTMGPETNPLLVMSPIIAKVLSAKYTKKQVQELLFQKARIPAQELDKILGLFFKGFSACSYVEKEKLPKVFCESQDPNRLVPMWQFPEALYIVVAGDYARNRFFATNPSGTSHLTTKEIKLPQKWSELVPEFLK